jgi:hypothetical protein
MTAGAAGPLDNRPVLPICTGGAPEGLGFAA